MQRSDRAVVRRADQHHLANLVAACIGHHRLGLIQHVLTTKADEIARKQTAGGMRDNVDLQDWIVPQFAQPLYQRIEFGRSHDHTLAPVPRKQHAVGRRGHRVDRNAVVAAGIRQRADQAAVEILARDLVEDAAGAKIGRAHACGVGLTGQRQREFVQASAEHVFHDRAGPDLVPVIGAIQPRSQDARDHDQRVRLRFGRRRRIQLCQIGRADRAATGSKQPEQQQRHAFQAAHDETA
ncbi:MAG: hypothetical protein CVV17_04100 [Gammaproteobacteria bacterium HGW-Gammaproteobacteria-7]|nr:MAG: hypothetical protein CVV17_04100 [Gammaproteobacteria bacterium HGW-Gammaproteobacteria-7]